MSSPARTYLATTTVANGRRSSLTDAGPIESRSTGRLITADTRAAVVRRASTLQAASPPAAPSPRAAAAPMPRWDQGSASCQGVARPCALRDMATCTQGAGCFWNGLCSGSPLQSCFGRNQFSCGTTPGCFWQAWTKTCGGFLTCAGKGSFTCGSTPGCFWQSACTGKASKCSKLRPESCADQPGCELR